MTKRKLIGSLLGGGLAISLLSYGGVKAGEKIHYDGQVKHFGGLRNQFIQQLRKEQQYNGQTMAKWEDIEVWKTYYERNESSTRKMALGKTGESVVKKINSPTELRDECYDALTNKDLGFKACDPNWGWCNTCLFQKGFYGTDKDNY